MLLGVRLPPPQAADAIRRAWSRRLAVAPLDPRAPEPELRRLLAAVRPTHLLDENGERAVPDGVPARPDVAAVVATSGTSGQPRAVELTWSGLEASAQAVRAALGIGPDDRWLCRLPLHHVAGLVLIGRAWATATPVAFDDGDPAAAEATLVSLVPTQVRRLAAAELDRFRHVLVGGGPVPDDIRALPPVIATYGLTETWGGVVHDGHALPGVEIALGHDEEILIRSPMVMRGYRLDPVATAAAFTSDGWLRTGDRGRWGPDGRLEVVDRLRDIVITGGVNVSPTEVEAVLARHPHVADVAVVGGPDPEWGERVVAFVAPSDPARPPSLEDLRSFARPLLSPPKLPRQVVLVDAIPRTAGGKRLRRLLRDSLRPATL